LHNKPGHNTQEAAGDAQPGNAVFVVHVAFLQLIPSKSLATRGSNAVFVGNVLGILTSRR
jgi:hypothetical protein